VPSDLTSLSQHLAARDFRVAAPTLPGHGTSPRELRRTGWRDWYAAASAALDRLSPPAVIAGLSMGGLLALRLAARHPERVAAIALLSVPLWLPLPVRLGVRVLAPVLPYVPKRGIDVADPEQRRLVAGYRRYPLAAVASLLDLMQATGPLLGQVRAPALVIHARQDHTAPLACADEMARRLGGAVRRVTLERSFHVVTLDVERDHVAKLVGDFFSEIHA